MPIESPEVNQSIDLKHRLALEVELMNKMIGKDASQNEKLKWIDEYSEQVRKIIFEEDNSEIRELALNGQYQESAELIFKQLNKNSNSEIHEDV